MITDEQVEKAIDGYLNVYDGNNREAAMRAALEAAELGIQEGWQLVPREPTDQMITMGWGDGDLWDYRNPASVYKDMRAAAPPAPAQPPETVRFWVGGTNRWSSDAAPNWAASSAPAQPTKEVMQHSGGLPKSEHDKTPPGSAPNPQSRALAQIDIVFDGPPGPEGGRFVEVESPPGTGINFGEWVHREDGYWVLRFEGDAPVPSTLAANLRTSAFESGRGQPSPDVRLTSAQREKA